MRSDGSDADVVVIGAGPVGLSAAIDLVRRGMTVFLAERRTQPSTEPRAHVVNGRTMEIFRSWGVSGAIEAAALDRDSTRRFSWLTRMIDDELVTLDTSGDSAAEFDSPERLCSCPQDAVEAVLLGKLREFPTARIHFGHEAIDVAQSPDTSRPGATVTLKSEEGLTTVSARFVIAADGARSAIRTLIGSSFPRSEDLGRRANVYFRADLSAATRGRSNLLWFVMSPAMPGIFTALNGTDRWVYSINSDDDIETTFTNDHCTELLRAATGIADLRPDIQSVLPWWIRMAVADLWRVGSVFLAGDAAHQFPPTGGFGMNSGIQDVHNLVWKIDAVMSGVASDSLLDSYEQERKGVAMTNAMNSMENARNQQEAMAMMSDATVLGQLADSHQSVLRQRFADEVRKVRGEFLTQGQQFGFVYESSAVVGDGHPGERSTIPHYVVSAEPGARAPHIAIATDGGACSTIDLFAAGWVILSRGRPWTDAAEVASRQFGFHVSAFAVVSEGAPTAHTVVDTNHRWDDTYGLPEGAGVLVRPDGHIAARWIQPPNDRVSALAEALSVVLAPALSAT
jgi:putative polyketide hydroxylase